MIPRDLQRQAIAVGLSLSEGISPEGKTFYKIRLPFGGTLSTFSSLKELKDQLPYFIFFANMERKCKPVKGPDSIEEEFFNRKKRSRKLRCLISKN